MAERLEERVLRLLEIISAELASTRDGLRAEIGALRAEVGELRTEMRSGFVRVERRLGEELVEAERPADAPYRANRPRRRRRPLVTGRATTAARGQLA